MTVNSERRKFSTEAIHSDLPIKFDENGKNAKNIPQILYLSPMVSQTLEEDPQKSLFILQNATKQFNMKTSLRKPKKILWLLYENIIFPAKKLL